MPTNRTRRPAPRRGQIADAERILGKKDLLCHLVDGRPLFSDGGFKTLAEFEAAWKLCRDFILPNFIKRHPGRRPFGWWRIDHQQERDIIVENLAGMSAERFRKLHVKPHHFGYLHTRFVPQVQESEFDHLSRYGLLEFGEAERIDF